MIRGRDLLGSFNRLKGKFMALKIFTFLALGLATTVPGRAATAVEYRLVGPAFFSDACRQQAEGLGITRTSDANALLAAFAGLRRQPANPPPADRQRGGRSGPAALF